MIVRRRDRPAALALVAFSPFNDALLPIQRARYRRPTSHMLMSEDNPMSAYDQAMKMQSQKTISPNVAPASDPASLLPGAPTTEASPWEQLAGEWSSLNSNVDEEDSFAPAVSNGVAEFQASITSVPELDMMTREVEDMSREVESTFLQLESMESEIFDMVDALREDKQGYEETIEKLKQDSSVMQSNLEGRLAEIQKEYNDFRLSVTEENRAEREAAQASQNQLQTEVQKLQTEVQEKIQEAREQESKARNFLDAKGKLEQELDNLQRESTLMIDEFRTKFFTERDARYQEVKSMQAQLHAMELDTRDMLEEALAEGEANLDREWVEHIFQLLTESEAQNDFAVMQKDLAQKDKGLAELHAHSAYLESIGNGGESHSDSSGGPLSSSDMDLPEIKSRVTELITNLQKRDVDYREVMGRLQDNYDINVQGLQTRLDDLVDEYEAYKTSSSIHRQNELDAAQTIKERLQTEIDDLQQQLKKQIDITKAESDRADRFLEERFEMERELLQTKQSSTSAIDELKVLYEAEKQARLEEHRVAYEKYQELFNSGRRWVVSARKDGLDAYKRLKADATEQIEVKSQQVDDTLSLLAVAVVALVSLLALITSVSDVGVTNIAPPRFERLETVVQPSRSTGKPTLTSPSFFSALLRLKPTTVSEQSSTSKMEVIGGARAVKSMSSSMSSASNEKTVSTPKADLPPKTKGEIKKEKNGKGIWLDKKENGAPASKIGNIGGIPAVKPEVSSSFSPTETQSGATQQSKSDNAPIKEPSKNLKETRLEKSVAQSSEKSETVGNGSPSTLITPTLINPSKREGEAEPPAPAYDITSKSMDRRTTKENVAVVEPNGNKEVNVELQPKSTDKTKDGKSTSVRETAKNGGKNSNIGAEIRDPKSDSNEKPRLTLLRMFEEKTETTDSTSETPEGSSPASKEASKTINSVTLDQGKSNSLKSVASGANEKAAEQKAAPVEPSKETVPEKQKSGSGSKPEVKEQDKVGEKLLKGGEVKPMQKKGDSLKQASPVVTERADGRSPTPAEPSKEKVSEEHKSSAESKPEAEEQDNSGDKLVMKMQQMNEKEESIKQAGPVATEKADGRSPTPAEPSNQKVSTGKKDSGASKEQPNSGDQSMEGKQMQNKDEKTPAEKSAKAKEVVLDIKSGSPAKTDDKPLASKTTSTAPTPSPLDGKSAPTVPEEVMRRLGTLPDQRRRLEE